MSIMERMRSGTDSTIMQVIFLAVVVSFVGWGVGAGRATTPPAATVNGEAVSGADYARAYRMAELRASSQSKSGLTDDDRARLRDEVIDQIVRQTALEQEARALGLEVSAAEIAEELFTYPNLVDENGVFDKRAFENFLRRQGLTRADFEEQVREGLLVQKLQRLMILGASVSDAAVRRSWEEASTKLDIEFVRVRSGSFRADLNPTDEALEAWAKEREAEVKARYELDLPRRYDQPESVTVRLIRLPVRDDGLGVAELKARLEVVRAEIVGGADFGLLARRWSEDPSAVEGGVVPDLPVADLDAEVAAEVQKLADGELSPVLATARDVRLYQLESRRPAKTTPYEEVRLDVAKELYRETEAPAAAAAFAEKELLPAWQAAGAAPAELLASKGLEVQRTGLVSRDERSLLVPPAAMLRAARAAEAGTVLPEVYEEGGVLWVGALAAREDPDAATFEQDLPRIRERALVERRMAFFEAWVDDVVARAKVTR